MTDAEIEAALEAAVAGWRDPLGTATAAVDPLNVVLGKDPPQ